MADKPTKPKAKRKASTKAKAAPDKPKRKRGRPPKKNGGTKRKPKIIDEKIPGENETHFTLKEAVTEQRIAQMDKALRTLGWSTQLGQALARQWNIHPRYVYHVRMRALDRMRQDEDLDLPTRRAAFLAEVREVRRRAMDEGKFGPATACLKMEGQVMGVFRPLELDIQVNPQAQKSDEELAALVNAEAERLKEAARIEAGRGRVLDATVKLVK